MQMKAILFSSILYVLLSCGSKTQESAHTGDEIDYTEYSFYGIAKHPDNILGGLKVGDTAPDFELPNQDGLKMSLSNELVHGNVLLVFYRGHWCPICNRHLAALQGELQIIQEQGIRVIAISSDDLGATSIITKKNDLSFPILSDLDHAVMRKYKVLFHRKDDIENMLPVPATYLINKDRKVRYVHYDPNYKNRSTVQDILAALK